MKLILLMAMTADGKIARHGNEFPNWTGKADKKVFKSITEEAGVVIMGSRTFLSIGKPLSKRLNVVLTRRPQAFQGSDELIFTADSPQSILQQLTARGYHTAILAGGAMVNTLFLKSRLIDEMMLTIVPRFFGQGLSLFTDPTDVKLSLMGIRHVDKDSRLIHYRLIYNTNREPISGLFDTGAVSGA